MINWLKIKKRKYIVKKSNLALQDLTNEFKNKFDDSSMATIVALSYIMRIWFEKYYRFQAAGVFSRNIHNKEIIIDALVKTYEIANAVRKDKQGHLWLGAMVWVCTLASLLDKENFQLGKKMWVELKRGFQGAEENLKNIRGNPNVVLISDS